MLELGTCKVNIERVLASAGRVSRRAGGPIPFTRLHSADRELSLRRQDRVGSSAACTICGWLRSRRRTMAFASLSCSFSRRIALPQQTTCGTLFMEIANKCRVRVSFCMKTAEMYFSKTCFNFARCYGNQGWAEDAEKEICVLKISSFKLSESFKSVAQGFPEIFEKVC